MSTSWKGAISETLVVLVQAHIDALKIGSLRERLLVFDAVEREPGLNGLSRDVHELCKLVERAQALSDQLTLNRARQARICAKLLRLGG